MENYLTDFEKVIASFLLKALFILGSIFVLGIGLLMIKDALTFSNGFFKSITFISISAILLITILSSICLYKKIK